MKIKNLLTGIFFGIASYLPAQELKMPELKYVPDIEIRDMNKSQTGDLIVLVGSDPAENAQQLEITTRRAQSGQTILLPNAVYDAPLYNGIDIRKDGVRFTGMESSMPTEQGKIDVLPTTGAFIQSELEIGSSITLENLIFREDGTGYPNWFIDIKTEKILINNCYFIGNKGVNSHQFGISITSTGVRGVDCLINNCLFTSFACGSEISDTNSIWRNNIFKNCNYGFIGNAGANLGTLIEPGNNLFYRNQKIAWIGRGTGYPMQWGWFYDVNGQQLRDLRDILDNIVDTRITPLDIGEDILIVPFHETPHPLLPEQSMGVNYWEFYK